MTIRFANRQQTAPGGATPADAVITTFSFTGTATNNFLAAPGYRVPKSTPLELIEVAAFLPPVDGPLTLRLWRYTNTGRTQLGSDMAIPALGRRVLASGLGLTLNAGEFIRPEIVTVGPTYAGGGDIQVTLGTTGAVLPAVSVAPSAVTGLSAAPRVGGVDLYWTAAANAVEYIITRDGIPVGTVPVGTNTYRATAPVNGTVYSWGVLAANLDACGALVTTTAAGLAGSLYSGSALISDTTNWTPTSVDNANGNRIAVNGTYAQFTTSSAGAAGSKSLRTAVDGAGKTRSLWRIRWGQQSGGLTFKTRRTAADDFGVLWIVKWNSTNNVLLQVKKTGDSFHTTNNQTTFAGTTSASDMWVEIIDNPSANLYEIRIWTVGTARPATATLAANPAGTAYASLSDASIATGRVAVEQTNVSVASVQTMTVQSVEIGTIP